MSKISVIIPVYNEADRIVNLLSYLVKNGSEKNILELIIVDGGSQDETCTGVKNAKLKTKIHITLVHSKKGRAKQMNAGARIAKGSILYFLHADSYPPKGFDKLIVNQVNKNNLAGCFKMKFDSNHIWLKLAGWFTQFSLKSFRGGDQSLFVTKTLFYKVGGFNETFTIYEDNDLIRKLYDCKQFVVIQHWLTTSARCYNTNGVFRLQFHYWTIHLKKMFGASPKHLNDYYLKHVSVKN
ncbi:TIGR04283 family arsenosugar biosynthesis glycosyltransferase [Postechiella marina]|uniref:TIGR04283 family arsenosugar biosynthesis glycosyltransferase n=1 Tax=Postechiella marina TaxID=943941 RepID=A0ABP8CFE6_9FLAO